MPAKSKAQFRFLKGVEYGSIPSDSLSKNKAKEMTKGNTGKKKYSKLIKKMKE